MDLQNRTIMNLIKRQIEIQNYINKLNDESLEITKQLLEHQIVLENGKDIQKKSVQKKLESVGYNIITSTEKGNRLWKIKKNNKQLNVLYRESSYHEGKNNAWYTLKPDVENQVDFVIFNYTDTDQCTNSLVIDNKTLRRIISNLKKTPDGRTNINIYANARVAKEIVCNEDLTPYINNFDLINL